MSTPKLNILIVGCGYRGKRLAQRLIKEGHSVRGLTRSAEHAVALRKIGIAPHVGDVTKPETLRGMGDGIDAVYHLMGSMQGTDEQLRALHVDGTRNVLAVLEGITLKRYVYESSTAVYGQIDGEWIDESAPRDPASAMGKLRVQAENILLAAYREKELPLIILRPSSIYRPEGVVNKKIREGTYVLSTDPAKVMNHIYVDDFIEIMAAALTKGNAGDAYNVSDDEPKPAGDYMNLIAELMGAPAVRVDFQSPAEGCADLLRKSNKRCSNAKLKADFGITLRFPTYREGLRESARVGWRE